MPPVSETYKVLRHKSNLSAAESEELGLRIIYDERRSTNPCFLLTGLAWGGTLAITIIAFLQEAQQVPSELRFVPDASAEVWAAGWELAGLTGGISLIAGLLLRAAAIRIAVDENGIMELRYCGGDRYLLKWADVRSWRMETYDESYDTECTSGIVTRTRLVVELTSSEKPFVVEQAWQTAVVTELVGVVPMLRGDLPLKE